MNVYGVRELIVLKCKVIKSILCSFVKYTRPFMPNPAETLRSSVTRRSQKSFVRPRRLLKRHPTSATSTHLKNWRRSSAAASPVWLTVSFRLLSVTSERGLPDGIIDGRSTDLRNRTDKIRNGQTDFDDYSVFLLQGSPSNFQSHVDMHVELKLHNTCLVFCIIWRGTLFICLITTTRDKISSETPSETAT